MGKNTLSTTTVDKKWNNASSTDYWGSILKVLDEGIVVMEFSISKEWFVLTILSALFGLS